MRKRKFQVRIAFDECKGCKRCVNACPRGVLTMGVHLNVMGVPAAEVTPKECVGCGICFYTCPEPGAITILKLEDDENESEK